jgi:site-specific recombinase XerD
MTKWDANFEAKVNKLNTNATFNEASKALVLEYIKSKKAQNVTAHRLNRLLDFLWHLLDTFKYDMKELSEERIEEIVIWVNGNPEWKDWTKYTYLGILHNFTEWLNGKYKLGLTTKIKRKQPKNSIMPEYLLTPKELEKLLNGSPDPQTKLFLNLVYESAARIGEILTLKIQNVSFNTYGARLFLKGKTGQRIVPIVWYANNLRQFIENHPLKENPEANLWYFIEGESITPIGYDVMRIRLKRLCKSIGIKKRVHWHLLRHQRCTEMAQRGLGESNLRRLAGWSDDSKMVKTYVNLSNTDVENSVLERMYGIKTSNNKEDEPLRICAKCNEVNPYFSRLCQRCKTPLNEKDLTQNILAEDKIKEIEDWSQNIMAFLKVVEKKHPDIWEDMKTVTTNLRRQTP